MEVKVKTCILVLVVSFPCSVIMNKMLKIPEIKIFFIKRDSSYIKRSLGALDDIKAILYVHLLDV